MEEEVERQSGTGGCTTGVVNEDSKRWWFFLDNIVGWAIGILVLDGVLRAFLHDTLST